MCVQLVNLMYTYGGLRHHSVRLMEAARPELLQRMGRLAPRHLYLLAWAWEQLKYYDA